jgi:DNA-binding transcriptional ArsR family regulator
VNLSINVDDLDVVFAALANPHRRKIVDLLALQPASIGQVAEQVGLSLTAINRHITVLEEAGLIQRRKSGRVNFLAIRRSGLRLVQEWARQYDASWGTDDETLDNYVATISRAESATPQKEPTS